MQVTTHRQWTRQNKPAARSTPRPASIANDPDMSERFAALEMQIAHAGVELLSAALACPRRITCRLGVEAAVDCGITVDSLPTTDQRIIFSAMTATAPDYKLALVLPFARYLLKQENRWRDDVPSFGRGPFWSNKSLIDLAEAWPGSAATSMFAHKLIELQKVRDKIVLHFDYCVHLLKGVE